MVGQFVNKGNLGVCGRDPIKVLYRRLTGATDENSYKLRL
jgi:hypothetical protein